MTPLKNPVAREELFARVVAGLQAVLERFFVHRRLRPLKDDATGN
jgi:hypothetical protein